MADAPQPPMLGKNKAWAALGAGVISTGVVAILNQYLPHPVPPEGTAAVQALITMLAVYYTPHGNSYP